MDLEHAFEKPANLIIAIGGACAAIWAGIRLVPKAIKQFKEFVDSLTDLARILTTLKAILENQHEATQVRAVMLDSDNHRAYFKMDAKGKLTWASRSWYCMTGLNEHEAKDYGWENGIAEQFRGRVLKDWQEAVDHQRNYEGYITYVDRDHNKTRTRVFASVIKTVSTEHALIRGVAGWFGVCEILTGATSSPPVPSIPASTPK